MYDSEGNFVPTEPQQPYHEPVEPHAGNYAGSIVSVILSVCFFALLIVGIVEQRQLVAVAGVVLVYCMIVIMPIAGVILLGYPLWRKWHLDRLKLEHARLDVQAKQQFMVREQEKHEVRMYLAQSRLLPDANGNRPYVFNPRTYGVVEVSSGNFIQNVPAHFHLEYNNSNTSEQVGIDSASETPALPAPVMTFSELLRAGMIQETISQGKMVLGYTGGSWRYGSWLDLYSCAIGGVSGSGKTTTVRFLLFQGILAGAKLIMIDPHIGEPEESLAAQFRHFTTAHYFKPCDDTVSLVLQRVRWLKNELAKRKNTGAKTPFLVLVIDEFNAVMRNKDVKDELSELLVSIAQEGRKFGLFAMLIGQRWASQDIGGSDIRTSLASTLAHRFTDEGQAKLLIGGRTGAKCLELSQGHYWFRDTNGGICEMVTPYTDVEDGAMIERLLHRNAASARDRTPETTPETTRKVEQKPRELYLLSGAGGSVETTSETTRNYRETTLETTPETTTEPSRAISAYVTQVVRLQAQGLSKPEIMREVWGVSPGGSQAYKKADTEYQQVMKLIAEKLGA